MPKLSWISDIRHFVFDLDGTLILGNQVLPFARECLTRIRQTGRQFTIVTNNSSRSIDNYYRFLNHLGFPVQPGEIHTSGKATAHYLSQVKPEASVYLMGTRALVEDFSQFGIVCVNEPDAEPIDFVVLAFDQELTYKRIVEASQLIRQGIPFIATHADINIPTDRGLLPDCGAMISMFETATGVSPKVIGKPNPEMIRPILQEHGLRPDQVVIIGDRLYTDIEMGTRSGIRTIWVQTGDTKPSQSPKTTGNPTVTLPNLGPLWNQLSQIG